MRISSSHLIIPGRKSPSSPTHRMGSKPRHNALLASWVTGICGGTGSPNFFCCGMLLLQAVIFSNCVTTEPLTENVRGYCASGWSKTGRPKERRALSLLLRALLQVAIAAEHLAVIGCRMSTPAPRLDMVAMHLLELELLAADGTLVPLTLVCLTLRTLVERANGQRPPPMPVGYASRAWGEGAVGADSIAQRTLLRQGGGPFGAVSRIRPGRHACGFSPLIRIRAGLNTKKENINPFLYVLRMKALKSLAAVGLWGHTHTSLHTWVLCV